MRTALELSSVRWYCGGHYRRDVIESIDATLDTEGRVLSSAIHGMEPDTVSPPFRTSLDRLT